jgi:hypothetical protein
LERSGAVPPGPFRRLTEDMLLSNQTRKGGS